MARKASPKYVAQRASRFYVPQWVWLCSILMVFAAISIWFIRNEDKKATETIEEMNWKLDIKTTVLQSRAAEFAPRENPQVIVSYLSPFSVGVLTLAAEFTRESDNNYRPIVYLHGVARRLTARGTRWFTRRRPKLTDEEYQASLQALERAEEARQVDPRLTVDYIDRFQAPTKRGEQYTDVQRKANWQMFAGRRVLWTGTVQGVTRLSVYIVHLKCGSTATGSDTSFAVPEDIALRIRKGTTIIVEGTLIDHSAFGYRLTDVQIK